MPCNMEITKYTRNYQQALGTWGDLLGEGIFSASTTAKSTVKAAHRSCPVFYDRERTTYPRFTLTNSVSLVKKHLVFLLLTYEHEWTR